MEFKKLFSLSKSMLRSNLDYQVINGISYKTNLNICALFKFDYENFKGKKYNESLGGKTFILGLFKRGTREYIKLPLEINTIGEYKKFEVNISKDTNLMNELKNFLEVDPYHYESFDPNYFLFALNKAIPTIANEQNLDRLVVSYSYPTSKDNEKDKIYFYSFRDNELRGDERSLENYEKTQKLLPHLNTLIGNSNISVRYTATPKDEDAERNEYEREYKEKF